MGHKRTQRSTSPRRLNDADHQTRRCSENERGQPEDVKRSGGAGATTARKGITVKQLRLERSKLLTEHFGYSNDDNPFGDRLLSEPFVWKKKNVLLQAAGKRQATTASALLCNSVNKVQEIKGVKKRREERESEEILLQQQREELQREKEREHFQDYFEKEEIFHRLMHIKKTEIRAEQNREQPIDYFVRGLQILNGEHVEKTTVLQTPPHEIFDNFNKEPLSVEQIEDLISDIKLHVGVETTSVDKDYQPFWTALLVISKDALERATRKREVLGTLLKDSSAEAAAAAASLLAAPSITGDFRDADSGIVQGVEKEIVKVLSGKTADELDALEAQIQRKLGEDDIDTSYWEAIMLKVPLYRARAVCLDHHNRVVARSIELGRQNAAARSVADIAADKQSTYDTETTDGLLISEDDARRQDDMRRIKDRAINVARAVEKDVNPNADGSYSPVLEPYEDSADAIPCRGPFSPVLFPFDEFRGSVEIVDPIEDIERRKVHRNIVKQREHKRRLLQLGLDGSKANDEHGDELIDPATKVTTFEEFVNKEKKTMLPDESVMAAASEQKLHQHYGWEEKYRPRKPRFFNRVRTGYFWNKYNQTHYDRENPPPKSVQGYKFNIFYPDLIDKTKAPTWTLESSDTPDTVVIRFHAGPPYEDVAFKIINREWHLERTRGFRNVFDRGILQLYFSFKKYVYRR